METALTALLWVGVAAASIVVLTMVVALIRIIGGK
jgi:hypothetical protein